MSIVLKTTRTVAFLASTALPLIAYREHFGSRPLSVACSLDEQLLDVVAARSEDGSAITIGVVNPGPEPQVLHLALKNVKVSPDGTAWLVHGDDPLSYNESGKQRLKLESVQLTTANKWEAPGYSFAVLRFPVE